MISHNTNSADGAGEVSGSIEQVVIVCDENIKMHRRNASFILIIMFLLILSIFSISMWAFGIFFVDNLRLPSSFRAQLFGHCPLYLLLSLV